MSTPEERIKELARKNAIGEADAERLLASVKPPPLVGTGGFDPFVRWSAGALAVAGLLASAGAAAMMGLGVRFPGVLDVVSAKNGLDVRTVVVDQLAAFPLTAAVFWIAGRVLSRGVRPIDMLATVGLARVPSVVCAIPVALLDTSTLVGKAAISLVLVGLAAQVYLLVIGFRTATGASGGRLAAGFVGAIVGAEVLAKIVISFAH
ncbi:MAG: hypothetical protein KIT84_07115 [Labilithrix sp.]|nr:hypothetical protein [Labilithrix sp.]MCW5810764.1 hypothetical protein [Labilithrix sp.]